jgi:hypothetical protein
MQRQCFKIVTADGGGAGDWGAIEGAGLTVGGDLN